MDGIRVACQTYTWEMLGSSWRGSVRQILEWAADAGYEGVEITNAMIREYADRPEEFAEELDQRGLSLAAFAYARSGFADPERIDDDLAGADAAISFVRHFPGAPLALGGASSGDPRDCESRPVMKNPSARAKLDGAIAFYNEVGARAVKAGVPVNVHPHSHFGSLLETAEEYDYLLERLDSTVSFGPDTGHIVRGGQDLLTCLRSHLRRITHLHLKDADANRKWTLLGEGMCDFPGVLSLLNESGYRGWVVVEEESEAARIDGFAAIRRDREHLRALGN